MSWWHIFTDPFTRPIDIAGDAVNHLTHGDLGGLAVDVIRLNPAVANIERVRDINNEIDQIWQFHLYFGNITKYPITVVAAPNAEWAAVDIITAWAMAEATGGVSLAGELEMLKNAKTMGELYAATKAVRLTGGVSKKLWDLYANIGNVIEPTEYRDVSQRSKSNLLNYLSPSQYAAWGDASDLSIIVMQKDTKRIAHFNCNSEGSWLAGKDGIIKSKMIDDNGGFGPEEGHNLPKPNILWEWMT